VLLTRGALGSARIDFQRFGRHVVCPFASLFVRVIAASSQATSPHWSDRQTGR
jgi:hypothetical protein